MTFDWTQFWVPLSPTALLSAFVVGLAFGLLIYGKHVWSLNHVYWMMAAGIVFFVPLSLESSVEGLDNWERFLAKVVLWQVFVIGTALTPLVRRLRS